MSVVFVFLAAHTPSQCHSLSLLTGCFGAIPALVLCTSLSNDFDVPTAESSLSSMLGCEGGQVASDSPVVPSVPQVRSFLQ